MMSELTDLNPADYILFGVSCKRRCTRHA